MAHIRTRNRQLYRNTTYSHVFQSKWRIFVEREAFIAKIRSPGNQRSTMELWNQMTYTNAIVTLPCYVWRMRLGFHRPIAFSIWKSKNVVSPFCELSYLRKNLKIRGSYVPVLLPISIYIDSLLEEKRYAAHCLGTCHRRRDENIHFHHPQLIDPYSV